MDKKEPNTFATISTALEDISNGKIVVVVDDEDRENEGDLVLAAQFATPEAINFMIKHGKGLVCLPVLESHLKRFDLVDMVEKNKDVFKTAFSVSFDASKAYGISTGISSYDRAKSIQVFLNSESSKDDIVTPGHLFPLKAREMGVLKRAGHTEAAVDLARLSGLYPAGVICEIIRDDGEMARVPDLIEFCKRHQLNMITIKDLIKYRIQNESFIEKVETVDMPTEHGDFTLTCYKDLVNDKHHYTLTHGNFLKDESTLIRVHSECITGDVFGSLRCDCGPQLSTAMRQIVKEGAGVILYMSQEGRGIGIANKLKAYKLQQQEGMDTVEANEALGFSADLRDYGVGAQMILDLGIKKMRLLTNNPRKIVGLEGYGLEVVERVPIQICAGQHNQSYLKTKKSKLGHMLDNHEKKATK